MHIFFTAEIAKDFPTPGGPNKSTPWIEEWSEGGKSTFGSITLWIIFLTTLVQLNVGCWSLLLTFEFSSILLLFILFWVWVWVSSWLGGTVIKIVSGPTIETPPLWFL